MAPLTRSRADDAGVPGELQATYYSQRASAGLIVTEATNISRARQGLHPHARHLDERAGRRLEAHHQGRARSRAGASSCSCGTWGASRTPTCSRAACSPWRRARCAPRTSRPTPTRASRPGPDAARAGDRRDPRHRRRLRACRPMRFRCRLRRRRDPLRQRLPVAAVPLRQDQQAHRPLRRLD